MRNIFVFLVFFFLIAFSIDALNAQEIISEETKPDETIENQSAGKDRDYNKSGLILSLGAFNYFSAGIGFNIGKWFNAGPHFAGHNYGAIMEYKTVDELHFRIYGNIYGGMYLGASAIFCTNFKEITTGIAPEIGLGFPGASLFYRYNFYLTNTYNCHEIVLLIYPIKRAVSKEFYFEDIFPPLYYSR
ncbi:MAG: hypothetical protein LBV52_03915 [Spirochaetaceae bacterium]|jgi:hypothetical protein|nr:hypothetical protein [Spirochaetaceae bacterium]